ncbi:polyketide synthase [Aspergillus ustus]|uniref:Polyketide synthase n=1 Tax=Aspergillus ustus TaxID=40382 RepID=A0A0C1E3F0_ASPUT|nr:polyketide synthase [Aspergillus ustus]
MDRYLHQIGAPFNVIDEIVEPSEISRLSHPLLSQPICSVLQIALFDLLAWWGIYPDSLTGHSSGEIGAAYAAGMLSMEDAIAVAYFRGVAARKSTVACVNSPSSVTISGDDSAIEELGEVLRDLKVFARRLDVEVAYHSHHMASIGREYLECIAHIKPKKPHTSGHEQENASPQFFSSVTGSEIVANDLGPHYWVQNLLDQVKFVDSLECLLLETRQFRMTNGVSANRYEKSAISARKVDVDILVEIGAHAALAGPIKQTLNADRRLQRANVAYISVLIRGVNATSTALSTVASLLWPGLGS